jgi:hypothetical protein
VCLDNNPTIHLRKRSCHSIGTAEPDVRGLQDCVTHVGRTNFCTIEQQQPPNACSSKDDQASIQSE